jgi:hypothetical protein
MVVPLETVRSTGQTSGVADSREIRIRFENRASLLDGFALAQKESWIEDCHVVLPRLELVIRMAGGLSIEPGQPPAPRRAGGATLSIAS